MRLTGLHDRQISEEHQSRLDGSYEVGIHFEDLSSTTFFCLLISDNLCRSTAWRRVLLDILHEEVKDTTTNIELNAFGNEALILRDIDQNLEHARSKDQRQVFVGDKFEHLFAKV